MRRRDLKWLGAGALAVTTAVAVVAMSALGSADQGAEGGREEAAAVPTATVEVIGARDVPALAGDDGSFAEALAAYLAQTGEPAATVTVVSDPEDPSGDAFYANVGGLWYSCEATGSASGWAFSLFGARSPVATGAAGDHNPGESRGAAGSAQASAEAVQAPASEEVAGGREWVPLSDSGELADVVGTDAASQLAEAMAGYAAAKGVGFDPASARVDASSVRLEPGGIGFEVDTGSAMVDVVYSGGEYGFKVI